MNFSLTIIPAVEAGNASKRFMFESKVELFAARDTCADLLLFMQDKAKVMNDYSNCFIAEEKIDGEWMSIDD